jgi:predicted Zn-dependent protease with MMP-like domain
MNLEQEFQKLMDEAIKSIADKRSKGELSHEEAADLVDMVSDRRYKKRAWNDSGCSYDEDTSYDDEGWNRSGQAC